MQLKMRCGILMLCILCLTGCAKGGSDPAPSAPMDEEVSRPDFDWQGEEILASAELTEGDTLKTAGYKAFDFSVPYNAQGAPVETVNGAKLEYDDCTSALLGDEICFVIQYSAEDDSGQNLYTFQYCYNGLTGESSWEQVRPASEAGDGYCDSEVLVGLAQDGFFFEVCDYDYDPDSGMYTLKSYKVVKTDRQRRILGETDLMEGIRLLGMAGPAKYRAKPPRCIADPDGYCYICDAYEQVLCRIDSQGNAKLIAEGSDTVSFGRAMDGTSIFAVSSLDACSTELFRVDRETGERQSMSRISDALAVRSLCVNETGLCYYTDVMNKIYRWDMVTGSRSECYDLKAAGVTNAAWAKLSVDREGVLRVYLTDGLEKAVLKLDAQGVEKAVTLKFYTFYEDEFFTSCAESFSRRHPDVEIVVEASAGRNEKTATMQMEIAAGAGPDMMIVDGETMHNLWDKGALADMTGMLEASTKEVLWSFLLENGTIDGKLAGLGTWYTINSMLVADDVWEGDTWTCMDVVGLLEREDAPEAFFRRPQETDDPGEILRVLVLEDLEHTPFIDWERGKCSFDSEDFIRVLKAAEKYGHVPGMFDNKGRIKLLKQGGKVLAEIPYLLDLERYTDVCDAAGEECHLVGFPTESGNGTYPSIEAYFCVNQASSHQDIVREFLEYCLNKENQRRKQQIAYNGILRKDIFREIEVDYGTKRVIYDVESSQIEKVFSEKQVDSYRKNYRSYMNLMENLAPTPVFSDQLKVIIAEEADAFFAGGQTAERTAEVIQNRVQLYLDER